MRRICILIFIVLSPFLYSEIVKGVRVIRVYGDVSVKEGDILSPNQTIKTGPDSYVELELSPGNSVRVKENSQVMIKDIDTESLEPDGSVVRITDFNLLKGDIILRLENLPKGSLIQVSSPTAVAGARGTQYIVRYEPGTKITRVGVLDKVVRVGSVGEVGKVIDVPQFKKVSITPWAMATAQVRGSGILSQKILGKPFIEMVNTPIMQADGVGDTEDKAKDNAYYNLSKQVLNISIGPDKRIEDILNEDPSLCQPLYTYIAKAKIVSTKKMGNRIEVTMELPIAPISGIIQRSIPPMPAIVKKITMEEYGNKFGPLARATTQRAAQLDGYRKLAELLYGTVISSKTTLKDYAIKDDRITTTVEGVVKGAEIIDTQYFSDGSVNVIMAIRADLVRSEVARITGDIFGLNYFTSPTIIDIDDYLAVD